MGTDAGGLRQLRARLTNAPSAFDVTLAVLACLALLMVAAIVPAASAGARTAGAFGALGCLALGVRRHRPVIATTGVGVAVVIDTAYAGNSVSALCFVTMLFAVFSVVTHARGRTLTGGLVVALVAVAAAQLVAPSDGQSHAAAIPFFEALLVALPAAVAGLVRARRRLATDIADLAVSADEAADTAELEAALLAGVATLRDVAHPRTVAGVRTIEDRARETLAAMRSHVRGLRAVPASLDDATSLHDLRAKVDRLLASADADRDAPITARLARQSVLTPRMFDLILFAAAAGLAIASAAGRPAGQVVLAVATCAPLAIARHWLLPAAVTSCGAALGLAALAHPADALSGASTATVQLALPALAGAVASRRKGALSLAACLATTVALPTVAGHHHVTGGVGSALAVEIAAALLGFGGGQAAQQLDTAAEAALERRREPTDQQVRRDADRRLTLARELHDAIAHSLTVVVLHASAARRSWDTAEQRDTHLAVIGEAVDETLSGLTGLLGRLRAQPGPTAAARTFPAMAELARRGTVAGLQIDVQGDVPCGVSLNETWLGPLGAQVVEEAITNAIRYAPGGAVIVAVDRERGRVEVTSTARPRGARRRRAASLGTGSGLAGLRERLNAAGGKLDATPTRDGGFRVAAELPLETAR